MEKGKLTKCSTGTLLTSGTTSEYWYVHDSTGKALQHDTLGKAISLMPGMFRVKVNNIEVPAEVKLNQTTEIKTGTLVVRGTTNEYYYAADTLGKPLVKGLTDEYYYVTDSTRKPLNHRTINKALAFFPGSYRVLVNKTEKTVDIAAAQTLEAQTGSLMVEGAGSDYYYVTGQTGDALNHNSLNEALSFFPAEYTVKLGENARSASVNAGQTTRVKF